MNREYERGQWTSLHRILALLNTYDDKYVNKSQLYKDVTNMRPVEDQLLDQPPWDYDPNSPRDT